jgi:hypothetical protein
MFLYDNFFNEVYPVFDQILLINLKFYSYFIDRFFLNELSYENDAINIIELCTFTPNIPQSEHIDS